MKGSINYLKMQWKDDKVILPYKRLFALDNKLHIIIK